MADCGARRGLVASERACSQCYFSGLSHADGDTDFFLLFKKKLLSSDRAALPSGDGCLFTHYPSFDPNARGVDRLCSRHDRLYPP